MVASTGWGRLTGKGTRKFLGDGNVVYLDLGSVTTCTCNFKICILCCMKIILKFIFKKLKLNFLGKGQLQKEKEVSQRAQCGSDIPGCLLWGVINFVRVAWD